MAFLLNAMDEPPQPQVTLIVGCGRSGTTLAYEILASHPDFAWISTWTDRSGINGLARFNKYFNTATKQGRLFPPRPSEGYRTWDRAFSPRAPRQGVVTREAVSLAEKTAIWQFVEGHCAAAESPQFLNKNTRNSRRIDMLAAVFPAAQFIHVQRNPLDTIGSLLSVHWWPDLSIWFENGRSPRSICRSATDEAILAARLYIYELRAIHRGRRSVPDDRWHEIEYEALVAEPGDTLDHQLGILGLTTNTHQAAALASVNRSSVGKYKRTMTAQQVAAARHVLDANGIDGAVTP
jgi:hypothetical protein